MQSEAFPSLSLPIFSSREPGHLVRTSVAAKIVGIPDRSLRHLAQKEKIRATRIGKRCLFFRIDDLLRLMACLALERGGEPRIPLQVLQHLQGKSTGGLSLPIGSAQ